jgi:hypothetical protein
MPDILSVIVYRSFRLGTDTGSNRRVKIKNWRIRAAHFGVCIEVPQVPIKVPEVPIKVPNVRIGNRTYEGVMALGIGNRKVLPVSPIQIYAAGLGMSTIKACVPS